MSESKSFQQRYSEACQKAGELQYRVRMQEMELAAVNEEIKKINVEAHEDMVRQAAVQQALAKEQEKAKLHVVPDVMECEAKPIPGDCDMGCAE